MKYILLIQVYFILSSIPCNGQVSEIIIPPFNDEYSNTVKRLEAGQTEIDYQKFRFSFIESPQFAAAGKKRTELDSLKKQMFALMDQSAYKDIVNTCKQILSIDYTNMLAHKIMRQTYKILGDSLNAAKYKTIQFGLLNSIVKKGDGKTCETAWPVIQISEEYFILQMLDAELKKQSIDYDGGFCDRMDVKQDGKKKTYYFEVSKVFEGYKMK